jgi:hypothetical protein
MSVVICIESDGCHLTEGKSYRIQWVGQGWVTVVNDIGRVAEYPLSYFMEESK